MARVRVPSLLGDLARAGDAGILRKADAAFQGELEVCRAWGFDLKVTDTRVYLHFNTAYDIEMTKYAMNLKEDSGNKLIGHVHKPNKSMELMNVMVDINSDGMRDKEYPVEKFYRDAKLGTIGEGTSEILRLKHIIKKPGA